MIGLRELLIIGMVTLVLYGRSGVLQGQRARTVLPWLSPVRRPVRREATGTRPAATPRNAPRIAGAFLARRGRFFWFLTILAATAVAALIIGRALIAKGSPVALLP